MEASVITPQKFAELYTAYKLKYVCIARSYVREKTIAEDIVSEAFSNFWEKRDSVALTSMPEVYILKSVKNRCLNYLRDTMRKENLVDSAEISRCIIEIAVMKQEQVENLFSSEIREIVNRVLGGESELSRKIFSASRDENLTYNEIADKFGITPRMVKREIQGTLAKLRTALRDYLPLILILWSSYKHIS